MLASPWAVGANQTCHSLSSLSSPSSYYISKSSAQSLLGNVDDDHGDDDDGNVGDDDGDDDDEC